MVSNGLIQNIKARFPDVHKLSSYECLRPAALQGLELGELDFHGEEYLEVHIYFINGLFSH